MEMICVFEAATSVISGLGALSVAAPHGLNRRVLVGPIGALVIAVMSAGLRSGFETARISFSSPAGGSAGIASALPSSLAAASRSFTSFTIDVNLTDGQAHQATSNVLALRIETQRLF